MKKSKKGKAEPSAETVREHEPEAAASAPEANGTTVNGHAAAPLNGSGGASAEPSMPPQPEPAPAAPPPPSAAQPTGPTPMERAGHGVISALGDLWNRRGVEATLGGVIALAAAIWLGGGSALTVPLVVLGVVLLLVGILGRRLRGRIALEWGPSGASFDFTAAIAPPGRTVVPDAPSRAAAIAAPPAEEPEDAEVVESTGETIEFDVSALRALLAAHDAADADSQKR